MEKLDGKNGKANILKTDAGKTKSSAIDVPSIALPKGGGAIKSIDEKFTVNPVNGTSSFSIPLPFSPGRGVSPSLALQYNSGTGNGTFGMGWALGLSTIKRKTDKGLPQYRDHEDSDTFLFSEAEDLVPEFARDASGSFLKGPDGAYIIKERTSADGHYTIRYFRPRIEGMFAQIERWTQTKSREVKWRIITRENVTTLFGWTGASRVADPEDNTRVFEWLPEFVFDDKGNCAHYNYKHEDDLGLDPGLLHNKNKRNANVLAYTNAYLESVLYGNKTPYEKFEDPFPPADDYLFSTVFDFGEGDDVAPFNKVNDWTFRADPFSDFKPGFERRTTRLCERVLLYHRFDGADEYNGLVKALHFEYDTSSQKGFTFLKTVISTGYNRRPDGTYSEKSLPPLEFDYQQHQWNSDIKTIDSEDLTHAPVGLDRQSYQFTDLFNEGIAGILTEQGNGWYYKHNLTEGKFGRATLVNEKPSFSGMPHDLQLMDLDADGGTQLVSLSDHPRGFFDLNDEGQWRSMRSFRRLPITDFRDENLKWIDLNGDGKADLLLSEDHAFTWFLSEGRDGFAAAARTPKPFDEEEGPHVVFADRLQTVFLADMTGDGLTDIVRIRNGEVCYWPNLGYGKFGAKVSMDHAPVFDQPDAFNPAYLRLADIDGSGTTDIIYVGKNYFSCWMNMSGNGFGESPFVIQPFPWVHPLSKVAVVDLLGCGVSCIAWSDTSGIGQSTIRYIDLMNSRKPHVMTAYRNNLGKEVSITYTPSTRFYIQDKLAGHPWITRLHFPVHCVSQTEIRDRISGYRFTTGYTYHHGYYDHAEREFRGFGRVDQTTSEDFEHWIKGNSTNIVEAELHQDPLVTKTWYNTGAFVEREKIWDRFVFEHWYEAAKEKGFTFTHHELPLPNVRLIAGRGVDEAYLGTLSASEWREAWRACKGSSIRNEVFANDAPSHGDTEEARQRACVPFSVTSQNCVIELLQPQGSNKYAVYIVKQGESIAYNYERDPADPRITHGINVALDEHGNVLESVSIVYPRTTTDASLPADTQQEQARTVIIYTCNSFTNDVIGNDMRRLRLPSETRTYELKGLARAGKRYSLADFTNVLNSAVDLHYHQVDVMPPPGLTSKRLIEQARTLYRRNNLTEALPLHQLESLAFTHESYQLAYTPELVYDIFGARVDASILSEGRYTYLDGDSNWWTRSGIIHLLEEGETMADAKSRFYVPVSYTDPYGAKTRVKYYGTYYLSIEETIDALGNNVKAVKINFRTLTPQRMRDVNGNFSEVITDELGLLKASAVFGKGSEADDLSGLSEFTDSAENDLVSSFFDAPDTAQLRLLGRQLMQHATTRLVYDMDAYRTTGKPAVAASIIREEHHVINSNAPLQLSFEYSNGLGQLVLKKVQAEPGLAMRVTVHDDNTYTVTEEDTNDTAEVRWIGNGKVILNNKGNPVKEYEAFFSVTHQYETLRELVETGKTAVMYYDAPGRLIRTVRPDGTSLKTTFDSWKQSVYDANDTCIDSSWYTNRANRLIDAQLIAEGKDPVFEQEAAQKSARHAGTPNILHFDTLGRPVLSIDQHKNAITGSDELLKIKVGLDAEGNLRKVTDARGNAVMQYKYDMLGNLVYQNSMDAGQRWLLANIMGLPLRTWDERNHVFHYSYDILHRPTVTRVTGGDDVAPLDHIIDRIIYGDNQLLADRSNETSLQSSNILGNAILHYDTGGLVETLEYDFKGKALASSRRLFRKYKTIVNWIEANLEADLESESYTFTTDTDALGRITRQVAPDGSIITPTYNEAGLLATEAVQHPEDDAETVYIKSIDYNEKGQRSRIVYGNDVITRYFYDKEMFRLIRLETRRKNNDPLQDWHYTYDPVGNITHIEDRNIPVTFFNNQKVTGLSTYTYDSLYRLIEATGRENNAALNFGNADNWDDAPFIRNLNPGDAMAMRNYTQRYRYDAVGNITQMKHTASGNSWTRDYLYETINNRVRSTAVGSQQYNYSYHDRHGFMTALPHLENIGWNFKEELMRSIRQRRTDGGTAETTYYQYDALGQRLRKVTENEADVANTPTLKNERIYIEGYEWFRHHSGADKGLERTTLSLLDEGHRFVMVDTETRPRFILGIPAGRTAPAKTVRYQLHNHIGSASLELDELAQVISYEEYHPYGTTAYLAKNTAIAAVAKRYRYTGMERDDETGLEYHTARYYLPWLARWLSSDPSGIADGPNLYQYVHSDPINYKDVNGRQSARVTETQLQSMSPGDVQSLIVAGGGTPGRCYVNPTFQQIQSDINILRGILIRANLYDTSSRFMPPPIRIVEDHTVVLMADSRGNGYIGPRYIVERQIDSANFGYQLEVLDNIRGGIGGTIGYMIDGERGSYAGAAVDGLLTAAGGTARARANNQAISRTPPPRPTVVHAAPAQPPAPVRPATPARVPATRPAAPARPPAPAAPAAPAAPTPRPPAAPTPAAPAPPAPPSPPATTWRAHETAVTARLRSTLPAGTPHGQQVTLDVTGPGGRTVTIRIDDLYRTPSGSWQLVDAKFSRVRDLTSANLTSTVTANQRLAYQWITSGTATSVVPRGTFAQSAGIAGTPIPVSSSVEIHVNSATGITVRNY